MFSGIIQSLQPIRRINDQRGHRYLTIARPSRWRMKIGDSICIDGVCSTVCKLTTADFSVEYMPETLRLTTFNDIAINHRVNLEKSLTLNDLVGGHLVSGHVDTVGEIIDLKADRQSKIITVQYPRQFNKYLIRKGSITINGISLTVITPLADTLQVALIQHTLNNTNLGMLKKGDAVNLEFDLIAKYLQKLCPITK